MYLTGQWNEKDYENVARFAKLLFDRLFAIFTLQLYVAMLAEKIVFTEKDRIWASYIIPLNPASSLPLSGQETEFFLFDTNLHDKFLTQDSSSSEARVYDRESQDPHLDIHRVRVRGRPSFSLGRPLDV